MEGGGLTSQFYVYPKGFNRVVNRKNCFFSPFCCRRNILIADCVRKTRETEGDSMKNAKSRLTAE